MAKLKPMIVAETLSLAVLEILRMFSERGVSKNKLDDLHDKLVTAVQADQRTMETFLRGELAAQIDAFRAESSARHEALRREVRRLVVALGTIAILASVAAAGLVGWWIRVG